MAPGISQDRLAVRLLTFESTQANYQATLGIHPSWPSNLQ
jgi:hypothetical protein